MPAFSPQRTLRAQRGEFCDWEKRGDEFRPGSGLPGRTGEGGFETRPYRRQRGGELRPFPIDREAGWS